MLLISWILQCGWYKFPWSAELTHFKIEFGKNYMDMSLAETVKSPQFEGAKNFQAGLFPIKRIIYQDILNFTVTD